MVCGHSTLLLTKFFTIRKNLFLNSILINIYTTPPKVWHLLVKISLIFLELSIGQTSRHGTKTYPQRKFEKYHGVENIQCCSFEFLNLLKVLFHHYLYPSWKQKHPCFLYAALEILGFEIFPCAVQRYSWTEKCCKFTSTVFVYTLPTGMAILFGMQLCFLFCQFLEQC